MRKITIGLRIASLVLVAMLAGASVALASPRQDIIIGLQLEPPHLDPTSAAAGAIDQVLYANVFEGLTRFAEDGSIIPALASAWQINEDSTIYTFDLHKGVRFHDGTAMDSEDVKFSLDRARAANSTNAQKALFADISKVEILTPHRVRITLSKPNGWFLFNLAWGDAVVVAPESIENIRTNPIGTGPFKLKRWQKGERIILERNLDYWGKSTYLVEATFRFIDDAHAAYAALKAGEVDAFPNYPAPENLYEFEQSPRFKVIVGNTEGETILAINNASPPFNDKRVRKAIALGLDRNAIIKGAMFGYGEAIGSHFAPHHPYYIDLTSLTPHNPEKAMQLLTEAGYPQGFKTTLTLPPPSYARRSGEIIQAQLASIGINAKIQITEWAQWLEQVFRNKDYALTIISHTEPFDINIYTRPDYYFGYANPELREVITRLNSQSDPEQQKRLATQAQRIIAEDYVNGFLFQLPQIGVINAKIEGLWKNAPTQAIDLTQTRWQN